MAVGSSYFDCWRLSLCRCFALHKKSRTLLFGHPILHRGCISHQAPGVPVSPRPKRSVAAKSNGRGSPRVPTLYHGVCHFLPHFLKFLDFLLFGKTILVADHSGIELCRHGMNCFGFDWEILALSTFRIQGFDCVSSLQEESCCRTKCPNSCVFLG